MSQSGAFILFGLGAVMNEQVAPEISIMETTLENKKQILKENDLLNINESPVFVFNESAAKNSEKYKFDKELWVNQIMHHVYLIKV